MAADQMSGTWRSALNMNIPFEGWFEVLFSDTAQYVKLEWTSNWGSSLETRIADVQFRFLPPPSPSPSPSPSPQDTEYIQMGTQLGDRDLCGTGTVITDGFYQFPEPVSNGGVWRCVCPRICDFASTGNEIREMRLSAFQNFGALNTLRKVSLKLSQGFVSHVENAIFDFDADSELHLLAGCAASFPCATTFSGNGNFKADASATITVTAAVIFDITAHISGSFLVSASTTTFKKRFSVAGSSALLHGTAGSIITASAPAFLNSAATLQGTEGRMQFGGGLTITAASVALQATIFSVSDCIFSDSKLSAYRGNVTCDNITSNTTTINCTNASLSMGQNAAFTDSTVTLSTTIASLPLISCQSATAFVLTQGTQLTVSTLQVLSSTFTISSTSSFALDSASDVSKCGQGCLIGGLGKFSIIRGLMQLSPSSAIQSPAVFGSTDPSVRQRALLQTDLTTTTPAVSACGAVVSSGLVVTGGSLSIDASCTYGTEAFNIGGSTSDYTVSAITTGAVDIQSGGLLVLAAVDGTSNVFSVGGSLTLSGTMEILVTSTGIGAIPLMKWDESSCTDITPRITLYNCDSCTVNVTSSSPAASCYLLLTFSSSSLSTNSSDGSDSAWFFLLLLVLLALVPVWLWYRWSPYVPGPSVIDTWGQAAPRESYASWFCEAGYDVTSPALQPQYLEDGYNFSFPALDPEYTNNVCAMPDGLPNVEPSVQELLLIPAFDPEYTNNVCAMPDGLPNEEPSVQELLLIL